MTNNNSKISLAVFCGGRSGEHDVSLMSSRSVISVLSHEKYDITVVGITREGIWVVGDDVLDSLDRNDTESLTRVTFLPDPGNRWLYTIESLENGENCIKPLKEIDVIFPVLHGTFGEDGTLQGLLEMADLAYVGAGVLGSSVCMDKALFKEVMKANHIPTVNSMTTTRSMIDQQLPEVIEKAEQLSEYPLYVKPANLGSSVGITRCKNRDELKKGLGFAARYDRRIIIEHGVDAREIEVSVLGNSDAKASVPGEIVPSDDFYSYKAKYIDDKSGLLIPAPISDEISEKIRAIAVQAYQAVDCQGMARIDFLLEKNTNEIYLNEINTIPGFTKISMYPKLWEATGLSYPALIDRLIELALESKSDRDKTERKFMVME